MKNLLFLYFTPLIILGCRNQDSTKKDEQLHQEITVESTTEILTDDVTIKHLQVGSEGSNLANKFHASYPDTNYEFINNNEEQFVQSFFKEFEIERIGKEEKPVTGLDFGQHFELLESNEKCIAFLIDRFTSYGNNYDTKYYTHIYDLKNEKIIDFFDFFEGEENLLEFQKEIKKKTKEVLIRKINKMNSLSETDRSALIEGLMPMIEEGTELKPKNYDGFRWNSHGSLTLLFDKYQVASGDFGVIKVTFEPFEYKKFIKEKYANLFHLGIEDRLSSYVKTTPNNESIPDCGKVPCVALTFDDGPAKYTNHLLDILKENNVQATFFVLGKSAKIQDNTLLRAYKEGHQIGNHSWDHKDLKKLSKEDIVQQINETNKAVKHITGVAPTVLRPPYGSFNSTVKSASNMPIILWSVDPLDWKDRNATIVERRILEKTAQNSIILSHDIHKTTVEAMPNVIKELKEKGYHLVTIDQLFAGTDLENGKTYSHR